MDNDNDKYDNNRHIFIEIINSEKTETVWDKYRLIILIKINSSF